VDITLKSESRRNYFQVEPTLASILIDLGLAEKKVAPPPKPVEPSWAVVTTLSGARAIRFDDGAATSYFYDDYPAQAASYFKRLGVDVPAEIIEKYRVALGDGLPNARRIVNR